MNALLGTTLPEGDPLATLLKDSPLESRLAAEFFLYDATPASILGLDQSLVNAPRLDNLTSAYAALLAICNKTPSDAIGLSFFADNEEIGNRTPQGADSTFLRTILARINLALGGSPEQLYMAMARSSFLSADAAHALHPNFPDKHDKNYAPLLGGGVVIKSNVQGRYCTNGPTLAAITQLARQHRISLQYFTNRADMPCGSTVGPTTAADLGIPGVDLGIPMLAMHSARETANLDDIWQLYRLMEMFQ